MSAHRNQSYDQPEDHELTVLDCRNPHRDLSRRNDIDEGDCDQTSHRSDQTPRCKELSEKHVRLTEPSHQPWSSGSNVYLGSYQQSPRYSRVSSDRSVAANTPDNPIPPSQRASISHAQLEHLLHHVDPELDTYGLEELRDGFFDASFDRPPDINTPELLRKASNSLPRSLRTPSPVKLGQSWMKKWHDVGTLLRQVVTTDSGLRLAKSFLAFFIAYIICLIPRASDWLGRYSYIMTLSAIINHSGRPLGSQIDGLILTVLGTSAGLGWGALALYVSTSTGPARSGYGGTLATFLVLLTMSLAWLRCVFIRFYQAVICAGIALSYTCLADTSQVVGWKKIFDYGVPWTLGQAIGLTISLLLFPDTGSRSLA